MIGSIVNLFLIRTAQYFEYEYVLAISFLPSLGVYFAGVLFGVNTFYLLFFIPFIWLSNLIYIYFYKKEVILKKRNAFLGSIKTSIIKAGILFSVAVVFVLVFNFPSVFLITMGLIQLSTAIIGSFIASGIYRLENKNVVR